MRKKKEAPAETGAVKKKRPFFTTNNLIASVVSFVVFLVASLGVYYITAGEFVTAKLAWVYVVLALVGSLSVLLRFYRFVVLYYIGCALGWVTGYYISSLKGEFAPTAGSLATVFFIAVFIMFGCIAQGKGLRKAFLRWREEKNTRKAAPDSLSEADEAASLPEAESEPLPAGEESQEDTFGLDLELTPDPVLELTPEEPEAPEPWDEDKLEEARKARESAELAMGLKLSVSEEPEKKPEEKREAKTAPLPLDLDEDQEDDLLKF